MLAKGVIFDENLEESRNLPTVPPISEASRCINSSPTDQLVSIISTQWIDRRRIFSWSQSNRHPFLIRFQGTLAVFALVKRGSETSDNQEVWDMAEFFILRGCRRHRIGTLAAQEVWRRFPGPWEIRVMQSNPSATSFWTQAISDFIQESIKPVQIEKDGKSWQLYSFRSE
jgi:predicted acetyltransferase